MKRRTFALPAVLLLILSCAGGPGLLDEAPDWVDERPADTADALAFPGRGQGESLALAKDDAISDLNDAVLQAMNLGDPSRWSESGRAAVESFLEDLENAVRTPEYYSMDGVSVSRKDGWKSPEGGIAYAVDILWDRTAFRRRSQELASLVGVVSEAFSELEGRATAAEDDGNAYEAALIWAAAAGVAEGDGNVSGYRQALRQVSRVLRNLEYRVDAVSPSSFVGSRPDAPFVISVLSDGKAVGNAEFVVTYPKLGRDGAPIDGEARILSDDSGRVVFLPPEISRAGIQVVTLAPSADPFLEYLDQSGDAYADSMIAEIERPALTTQYEAFDRIRNIPTGILILETDLAGNPLDSTAAAGGLRDDLAADGFDIAVMELDPREMITRTDRALLRDLKADVRFADRYDRVIHGTVTLESFDQDGDTYTVQVSGTLALSDIERQVALYRSEITKTSRAADGQQAVNSAFRQLGRSFAAELIDRAP